MRSQYIINLSVLRVNPKMKNSVYGLRFETSNIWTVISCHFLLERTAKSTLLYKHLGNEHRSKQTHKLLTKSKAIGNFSKCDTQHRTSFETSLFDGRVFISRKHNIKFNCHLILRMSTTVNKLKKWIG